uniref:Uncharacterized protein n=1 Tax=Ditylenchus dipsaci TaxID=166011 RepID=A0A915E6K3_9BILA
MVITSPVRNQTVLSRSSYNSSICAASPSNGGGALNGSSVNQEGFHLARVGLDDAVEVDTVNYKCIKVVNGDKMVNLIERALEKHMIDQTKWPNTVWCNSCLMERRSHSPMLNFLLKKRSGEEQLAPSARSSTNKREAICYVGVADL